MVIFGTLLNCNCGRMINIFGNRKQNALMINETNEISRENSVLYFTEYHRGRCSFSAPSYHLRYCRFLLHLKPLLFTLLYDQPILNIYPLTYIESTNLLDLAFLVFLTHLISHYIFSH